MNDQIRLLLWKKKLKHQDVAKELGISRITFSRYMNGKGTLNSTAFLRLLEMVDGRVELPR